MSSPNNLRAVSAASLVRIDESLASIEQAVRECPAEELPELAAAVAGSAARIDRLITLRLAGGSAARAPAEPEYLLTVAETAKILRISPGSVYARAQHDLKPAAVSLGPGTLRFSASGIQRFIRVRTG